MTATASQPTVPFAVRVIGVIAVVLGVLQVLGGVLLLIFNGDIDGWSAGEAVLEGIVVLIVGAVYVAVGRGLWRGSTTALAIGLAFSIFRVAYDLTFVLFSGLDGIGFSVLISLAVNAVVLAALWSGRAALARR